MILDELLASLRHRDESQQARLVIDCASITAPYGAVDPLVVSPGTFETWIEDLRVNEPRRLAESIAAECELVVERFPEEPEGAGWYAFGAVVGVLYAAQHLSGSNDGLTNAAKRFLDLLGGADDEGVAGIYELAQDFLLSPSEAQAVEIRRLVAAHALSLGGRA